MPPRRGKRRPRFCSDLCRTRFHYDARQLVIVEIKDLLERVNVLVESLGVKVPR